MTKEELEYLSDIADRYDFASHDYYGHADVEMDKDDAEVIRKAVKELEQEPCEDCISREKAKQFLYERIDRLNDDELYDTFSEIIDDMYNELSSVKPQEKTGYWIDDSNRPDKLICSNCNCEWDMWRYESKELKYCPNCGSYNGGGEDGK